MLQSPSNQSLGTRHAFLPLEMLSGKQPWHPRHMRHPEVLRPSQLAEDATAKPTEQLCGCPVCSGALKGYREAEDPDLRSPRLLACRPIIPFGSRATWHSTKEEGTSSRWKWFNTRSSRKEPSKASKVPRAKAQGSAGRCGFSKCKDLKPLRISTSSSPNASQERALWKPHSLELRRCV